MSRMSDDKILVIGGNGQLGTALKDLLPGAEFVDRDEFDVTNDADYAKKDWTRYKAILNVAAYTAVDAAETPDGRKLAWQINATAVAKLARVATDSEAILMHVSSDYVFDGTQKEHDEDELLAPLGVYGQTKAAGDIAASTCPKHYIVRTSWVIGSGKNFVRTMHELAKNGTKPTVVGDQFGRLTFAKDLAEAMVFLLEKAAPYGTYNFSNEGDVVSWAEIAKQVYRLTDADPESVTPITTEEYFKGKSDISPRPPNSALKLDKVQALGLKPRDWRVALENYMKEEL